MLWNAHSRFQWAALDAAPQEDPPPEAGSEPEAPDGGAAQEGEAGEGAPAAEEPADPAGDS